MNTRREFLSWMAGSFGLVVCPAIPQRASSPGRSTTLSLRTLLNELDWIPASGYRHTPSGRRSLLVLRTDWYVLKDSLRKPTRFTHMEPPFGIYAQGHTRADAEELITLLLKDLVRYYVRLKDPPQFVPRFWRAEQGVVIQRDRVTGSHVPSRWA